MWLRATETVDPWSFLIPPGSPVQEASGRRWSSPYPVVMIFWPGAFYQVCMLLKNDWTDYYCNVISPPRYDGRSRQIEFHDLDLDVRVTQAAGPYLVDVEEFEQRKRYYSKEWVGEAETAASHLLTMGHQQRGPFSPATAEKWRVWINDSVRNTTPLVNGRDQVTVERVP